MRKVLLAYDVSLLKTAIAKETFIVNLTRVHHLDYDFFESEGGLYNSDYACVVQYSDLNDVIVTRIITVVHKQTLTDWWGYRGPILPATIGSITLGSL